VAALIKEQIGAETDLEPGARGEFSVWVDGRKVAEKTGNGFPTDDALMAAVDSALRA
jgi:hypothetical protein